MKEERFFYVPDAASQLELPEEEAKHAIRVLRLREGDEMFLQDGTGTFYHATVSLANNKHCYYTIGETIAQKRMWRGHIHLAIAPTKMMERMEWMAEKATEVGFDEITFLDCKFSERKKVRTDRIEKIIVSAFKQSRKGWLPTVNDMIPFEDFVNKNLPGRKFICHCYNEIAKRDFFSEISDNLSIRPSDEGMLDNDGSDDITVLVGPEGDFSIDEVRMALDRGYESVSLGTSRLRTETAGLSAVMMSQLARRL